MLFRSPQLQWMTSENLGGNHRMTSWTWQGHSKNRRDNQVREFSRRPNECVLCHGLTRNETPTPTFRPFPGKTRLFRRFHRDRLPAPRNSVNCRSRPAATGTGSDSLPATLQKPFPEILPWLFVLKPKQNWPKRPNAAANADASFAPQNAAKPATLHSKSPPARPTAHRHRSRNPQLVRLPPAQQKHPQTG